MSKDLFFHFLKGLPIYEECTLKLEEKIRRHESLHIGAKDCYSKTVPELSSSEIITFIKEIDKLENYFTYRPTIGTKIFQQNYIIFSEKVRIWVEWLSSMSLKPFMDPLDLIKRCVTERQAFADYLKDYLAFSIRKTIGIDFFTLNEGMIFEDINQIFPPKHLINFVREKDISDLTKYAFKEPKISNSREELRAKFKKNILKNKILREYDLFDHLDIMDEKGSFEKGVNCFIQKMSGRPSLELPDHLLFRINSIQKTPCESRTIAIAEPQCKSFLAYTRSLYSPLLNARSDYYGKDRWSFEKYLHQKRNTFHFLFDQKKCGWTFPMELIEDFFYVLQTIYPIEPFIRLYDIFRHKDVFYIIDGVNVRPERGYTLGMFDSVCSFIVSCCFELLEDNLEQNDFYTPIKVKGIFFGDDCDIIAETEDIGLFKVIANKWLIMLDKYGISVNIDKSFFSLSGIFCEVYGLSNTAQMQKHTTYLLNGIDILSAHNTVHAKELFCSYFRTITTYSEYVNRDIRKKIIEVRDEITSIIIGSFPYEFLPNEYQFPYEVGGWIQFLEEGKNLLLQMCLNKEITSSWQRVSTIRKPKIESVAKASEKTAFNRMYNDTFWVIIDCVLEKDSTPQSLRDRYFQSLSRTNIMTKVYWKWQALRKEAFLKKSGTILPDSQIIFSFPWIKSKLSKEMFEERDEDFRQVCGTKPDWAMYKQYTYVTKNRALDMIRGGCKVGPYFGSEYPGVGIKDIYTSLDKNLAMCRYYIPTDWWELCNEWNISIEKFYLYLCEEGIDPFRYKPRNYKLKKKGSILYDLFDLSKEIIFWCDSICEFITISPSDVILIRDVADFVCQDFLISKIPTDLGNRSYSDYVQLINDFGVQVPDDIPDEDITPEEQKMIDKSLIAIDPSARYMSLEDKIGHLDENKDSLNSTQNIKTLEYKATVINLISSIADLNLDEDDMEEDLEAEQTDWEDINLGHDNVLDYSQQYLQNLDIEEEESEDEVEDPP